MALPAMSRPPARSLYFKLLQLGLLLVLAEAWPNLKRFAPMFVAGRPSWDLVLVVFIGGYLLSAPAVAAELRTIGAPQEWHTGVPLFLSEPIKCYYSDSFWVKMTTLPIAIAFAFTVRSRVTADAVRNTARRQMLVGALSIALWVIVAAAGRWIGFS